MDYRETLIRDVSNMLINTVEIKMVSTIINKFIVILDDYDVKPRETDLVIKDDNDEQLLKLYCGCLLTEGKSKKTALGYIKFLRRFKDDICKPLLSVNTFDIRVWIAKTQSTCSLRTCENYRAYLSAFYQWVCREDILHDNPMIKIAPIKYVEQIKLPFSDVEVNIIRSSNIPLRLRAEFELLLSSGIRASELGMLNIEDINFDTNTLIVKYAKGGKQRKTYINDICAYYLKMYLNERDDTVKYLFVNRLGNRLNKDNLEYDMRLLSRISRVDNIHPHRCRRTFATSLYKKGMDIHNIQQLMGHSDINTTMTYISKDDNRIKIEYERYS